MSLFEEKHKLFADYRKELDVFEDRTSDPAEVRRTCDEYINSSKCTWKNIFDKDTQELAGFLIIGKEHPYKHYETDRCIEQAYVAPKYRKKGLMTACMKDYESRHHGVWGYFVIKTNTYAAKFWDNLFREMGYIPTELNKTVIDDDEGRLDLVGWCQQ